MNTHNTMYLTFEVDAADLGLEYGNLPAAIQLGAFTLRMRGKMARYAKTATIPVALYMGKSADYDGTNAVVTVVFTPIAQSEHRAMFNRNRNLRATAVAAIVSYAIVIVIIIILYA